MKLLTHYFLGNGETVCVWKKEDGKIEDVCDLYLNDTDINNLLCLNGRGFELSRFNSDFAEEENKYYSISNIEKTLDFWNYKYIDTMCLAFHAYCDNLKRI